MLNDVISMLETSDNDSNIDYARYKINWICTPLLRIGGTLEESVLTYLQRSAMMLSTLHKGDTASFIPPPAERTGLRGRHKFDVSCKQLEYFL